MHQNARHRIDAHKIRLHVLELDEEMILGWAGEDDGVWDMFIINLLKTSKAILTCNTLIVKMLN